MNGYMSDTYTQKFQSQSADPSNPSDPSQLAHSRESPEQNNSSSPSRMDSKAHLIKAATLFIEARDILLRAATHGLTGIYKASNSHGALEIIDKVLDKDGGVGKSLDVALGILQLLVDL